MCIYIYIYNCFHSRPVLPLIGATPGVHLLAQAFTSGVQRSSSSLSSATPAALGLTQSLSLRVAVPPNLREWTQRAETFDNLTKIVRIAMIGKYVGLTDSYLSVVKALLHACIACSLKPSVDWIAASDLEDDTAKSSPDAHADHVLVRWPSF